jgi:Meckel syndrome type 1 protein
LSFPIDPSYTRDLSDPELWARSHSRAVHRREIAALSRKHAARRKGATLAVTASMAAGPTVLPLAAVASSGSGSRSVAAASTPARSSIHLPNGALVSEGDTGAAVVAIQRQVGVDDDGIFGPITRGAVEQFQARWGLAVTGEVDAKTWAALFKSTVSYLGDGSNGGGKRVLATYHAPSAPVTREHASTPAASSPDTAVAPPSSPAPAAPKTVSAPAPAAVGGGCGSGKIATPVSGTVTGHFGEARSGHAHAGEDIAAPTGTAVRAAQCGTVSQAGTESGYGNIVCIQHAGGVSTCYAHLSAIDVSKGAYVHVGDVIGKVGCTGNCTGPHLHFEVRENGTATDPAPYLAGTKAIAGGTEAKASTATPKATTAQAATSASANGQVAAAAPAAATAAAESAPATAPAAHGGRFSPKRGKFAEIGAGIARVPGPARASEVRHGPAGRPLFGRVTGALALPRGSTSMA